MENHLKKIIFEFMKWENIIGHHRLKESLQASIAENRISHAQLFVGKEGYGTMALVLAYVREIFKKQSEEAVYKVDHLNHVDLQISFPVYTEKNISLTAPFYANFREMILQNPYANLQDWGELLDSKNKQLYISADEIEAQNQHFSLKSFEGGVKILILWRADKMNVPAANKFLKFLEEPPKDTYIFLTAENQEDFLPTIYSRTQVVEVPRFQDEDIGTYLIENYPHLEKENLEEIVFQSQGNLNQAIKIVQENGEPTPYEDFFIQWVRFAFQVRKKPLFLKNIIEWSNTIASWNRVQQKDFLDYCTEMFRLALMQSYGLDNMVYKTLKSGGFKWEVFARFIHGANIERILDDINEAELHLIRNGNPKIVWTDLGIKLSRHIHRN